MFTLVLSCRLCYDRLDENLCELLTMTSQLAVSLAATLVEYENLVTLYEWNEYFENNLCSFNCWSANLYLTIVVYQQYFLNLNSCACLHILHMVDVELLTFFYFELLTLNFCNYVHFCFVLFRVVSAGVAHRAPASLSLSDINRVQS